MLLSLYASFRWVGSKNYLLKISLFIVVASFFSAGFGVFVGSLFLSLFLPLLFLHFILSFPFYMVFTERRIALAPPFVYSQRVSVWEIRFLMMKILQVVPHGPVVSSGIDEMGLVQEVGYRVILFSTEIGSIPFNIVYVLSLFFLFFVLVNIAGALAGYCMSKVKKIKELEGKPVGRWVRIAFGIALLAVGIMLSTMAPLIGGPESSYYHSYDPNYYRFQGFPFIVNGILWLVIFIAENI